MVVGRLHRADARVKVVMTFLLIIGIVLTPTGAFPAYPLLWGLVGSLAALGEIGVWRLARTAGVALVFATAALPLLFTTPGDPLIAGITSTGAERFVSIVLKSWLAAQTALLLSLTTPFTDLLWAFAALKLPAAFIAILSFMYRYLFVLQEEAERLLRARVSRSGRSPGRRPGGSLLWRARTAGSMVGSLFLRGYERSERVQAAMVARGYRGQMPAFEEKPLPLREIGAGLGILVVLAVIELAALLLWS